MVIKKSKEVKQLTKMIDTYIENNLNRNAFHTDVTIMFFTATYLGMKEQQRKIIEQLLRIAKDDSTNSDSQFHEDGMFYRILMMIISNTKPE